MTTRSGELLDPTPHNLGALLGWKAFQAGNGIVLRLETARSRQQAEAGLAGLNDIALNVRQMRALAHNLSHLADQHEGIERPARKKSWWG